MLPRNSNVGKADDFPSSTPACASSGIQAGCTTGEDDCRLILGKESSHLWQEGAAWFSTLVDGDLASNTLGWQWAGGCGADAAPYFHIFNPMSQSEKFMGGDTSESGTRDWQPLNSGSPPFEAKGLSYSCKASSSERLSRAHRRT